MKRIRGTRAPDEIDRDLGGSSFPKPGDSGGIGNTLSFCKLLKIRGFCPKVAGATTKSRLEANARCRSPLRQSPVALPLDHQLNRRAPCSPLPTVLPIPPRRSPIVTPNRPRECGLGVVTRREGNRDRRRITLLQHVLRLLQPTGTELFGAMHQTLPMLEETCDPELVVNDLIVLVSKNESAPLIGLQPVELEVPGQSAAELAESR